MDAHFSNSFGFADERRYEVIEQHLFIDARRYFISEQVDANTPIKFDVVLSGRDGNGMNIPPYNYVTKVELKSLCFPKVKGETYVIIDIPEFSGRVHSNDNKGSHESFAILYFDNGSMDTGVAKPMKGKDFDDKVHFFNPPESTINKFTVSFKKFGGVPVSFNDLVADGETLDAGALLRNISMMFCFTIKK